jgi:hypothetical protein
MSASDGGGPGPAALAADRGIIIMIQISVLLAVGVLIVGRIFGALPSTNSLGGAQTQVTNLTGQAFELAPIVLIVLVAGMIVGVVRRI